MSHERELGLEKIGVLLQKIRELDLKEGKGEGFKNSYFYSDSMNLEEEDG